MFFFCLYLSKSLNMGNNLVTLKNKIAMKKISVFTVLLLWATVIVNAQQVPSPTEIAHDTLDVNNWRVRINAVNTQFFNLLGASLGEIPAGSGKQSLFVGAFWIGGISDDDSTVHVSADRYGGCFYPGPYANVYDSAFYAKYNRVWKITKSQIEYHINHWSDAGYVMPDVIATWPGNGDTSNGEAPVLAPYADINGNGIYDPQNGDYPVILGDQAIYLIMNDKNCQDTNLNPMGIEIHAMFYAFDDTGVLGNTFFAHYDLINYSSHDYHDVYWGVLNDFDLGNYSDDFIGCDSTRNVYFCYNGDDDDDGNRGYGIHPPAVGFVFLSHPMEGFMYFKNGGGPQTDPETSVQYYNYMRSMWKDGTHLVHHGTGYDTDTTVTDFTNYAFPEYSGWTEVTEGNTPGDRRGLGSAKLGVFTHDSCFAVDFAYVWARDTVNPGNTPSLNLMLSQISAVTDKYSQLAVDTNCSYLSIYNSINTPYKNVEYFNLYPNPAQRHVNIRTNWENYTIDMYSFDGKKVYSRRNIHSLNLTNFTPGVYIVKISSGNQIDRRKLIISR